MYDAIFLLNLSLKNKAKQKLPYYPITKDFKAIDLKLPVLVAFMLMYLGKVT